jgi:hypothetical protein
VRKEPADGPRRVVGQVQPRDEIQLVGERRGDPVRGTFLGGNQAARTPRDEAP